MPDTRGLTKFLINILTTIGAGLSVVSIPYAFDGYPRVAWGLMGVALFIDWVDGTLVRTLDLEPGLTGYDGARLDEYADLMTYAVAPVLAAIASGVLPRTLPGYSTIMFVSVVSCLQFSRDESKSDKAFWGWPCYWNFVYFYCWGLDLDPTSTMVASVLLGLAAFAPIPFPYPSKFPLQRKILLPMAVGWVILVILGMAKPTHAQELLLVSLVFPLYYMALPLFYFEDLGT